MHSQDNFLAPGPLAWRLGRTRAYPCSAASGVARPPLGPLIWSSRSQTTAGSRRSVERTGRKKNNREAGTPPLCFSCRGDPAAQKDHRRELRTRQRRADLARRGERQPGGSATTRACRVGDETRCRWDDPPRPAGRRESSTWSSMFPRLGSSRLPKTSRFEAAVPVPMSTRPNRVPSR